MSLKITKQKFNKGDLVHLNKDNFEIKTTAIGIVKEPHQGMFNDCLVQFTNFEVLISQEWLDKVE